MRSNTHTPSDAQLSTTTGGRPVRDPPRTARGFALTVLLAALATTAAFAPVAAALATQALVIARFAGPPALATALGWLRARRPSTVLPGVSPVE